MSKGLEALKELSKMVFIYGGVEQYKIIEKELKALEIIKNKKINLEYLKCCETYEQYKTVCSYWNEITKEEYDLLKDVL